MVKFVEVREEYWIPPTTGVVSIFNDHNLMAAHAGGDKALAVEKGLKHKRLVLAGSRATGNRYAPVVRVGGSGVYSCVPYRMALELQFNTILGEFLQFCVYQVPVWIR